ncbi:response regulator [Pseudoalteromonas pernae]|uniref:response regulator n=1 Tax=Pseudoalteromonas pernae TaxID=3118054 RepID=UPI003241D24D
MAFNILICDDSTIARKQVAKALRSYLTCECKFATDGIEALQLLQQQHFDVLCLDLTMPKLDGIAVLQQLKKLKVETFVIVISADVQEQMRDRARSLGAMEFIAKPIQSEQLKAVLHKFGIY